MLMTMSSSVAPRFAQRCASNALTSGRVGAEREADDGADLDRACRASSSAHSGTQAGLTQTVAKLNSRASAQNWRICSSVPFGLSSVWSIIRAMSDGDVADAQARAQAVRARADHLPRAVRVGLDALALAVARLADVALLPPCRVGGQHLAGDDLDQLVEGVGAQCARGWLLLLIW